MPQPLYPQFCPVAMAASMLEPRWTMLVLCEMWAGSTRFNAIQRGVPGMSPALLSKRLKEMATHELIRRCDNPATGHAEYHTTPRADELEPIVRQLGEWAHRQVDTAVHNCVIQFTLRDAPDAPSCYWLVIKPGFETDLCYADPGHAVDLFVICDLRALTSAWMGHSSFDSEIAAEKIVLVGHDRMARTLTRWLIRSSFANPEDDWPEKPTLCAVPR